MPEKLHRELLEDHAQRKRRRVEEGTGSSLQGAELGADKAKDEVDWQGEFEPGISQQRSVGGESALGSSE